MPMKTETALTLFSVFAAMGADRITCTAYRALAERVAELDPDLLLACAKDVLTFAVSDDAEPELLFPRADCIERPVWVESLLGADSPVSAIKQVREHLKCDLWLSKQVVDALRTGAIQTPADRERFDEVRKTVLALADSAALDWRTAPLKHLGQPNTFPAETPKPETPKPETPKPEGWITWAGGECPVPDGARVSMRFRDGGVTKATLPEGWRWSHIDSDTDIVEYRVEA